MTGTSSELSEFWIHTVTVETYTGKGSRGDTFAAPVPVTGFLDDGSTLQLGDGAAETVAQTRFFTDIANAAAFVDGSRVTANGVQSRVKTIHRRDGGDLLPGISHVEVELQ